MNKQIEEMAQEIRAVTEYSGGADFITGERRVGESHSKKIARHLIEEKGYRKASEVAKEIFEEIVKAIEKGVAEGHERVGKSDVKHLRDLIIGTGEGYAGYIGMAICEVFKKYESEGGE